MKSSDLLDNYKVESTSLKGISFPLKFTFKITTLSNDFRAEDSQGNVIAFVRSKLFKFKEDVVVYSDTSKQSPIFKIKADKWIDFNTTYSFTSPSGEYVGSVGRKGMKSLWKASYDIFDASKTKEYSIHEENPWAKIGDSFLGELPIISIFTGYLFHPKYCVSDNKGNKVVRLSKKPSFTGRTFIVDSLIDTPEDDTERILLSLMMMVLLERRRG